MKYGWAIWNMQGCPQADKCRLAASMGLDFVSFIRSPLRWGRENPGEPAATPALLAELGLGWTTHGSVSNDEGQLAVSLDETLAFAAEAGPPLTVSFERAVRGAKPNRFYDSEATARGLELAFNKLGGLKTRIAIENHLDTSEPEVLAGLGERFPGLGMLLDAGHMNLHLGGGAARIAGYVASLPLPIVDLHLHDNDGEHDDHAPLETGSLSLPELAGALRARGYDDLATLEVCPGLKSLRADSPDDAEKLRRSLELAREHLSSRSA